MTVPSRPKLPIYVGRDAEVEITNQIIMAKTKTREKHQKESQNSPKKIGLILLLFCSKELQKKFFKNIFETKYKAQLAGPKIT